MQKLLFICAKNRLRSPTAEHVFARCAGIETDSAGVNHDADTPVSGEQLLWADIVFVMERVHRTKLQSRFREALKGKRIVCLDIADNYDYMDPELVRLLESKVAKFLVLPRG